MIEPQAVRTPPAAENGGAGELLRAARQSQGLDLGTLAATMKVPRAKIEALEAERLHELPDIAFARGLAQSICRVLKTDPAPVLARLPFASPDSLERVEGGLNMPFRERGGRDPGNWAIWRRPVFWVVVVLLLAAAAVAYLPGAWVEGAADTARNVRERLAGADGTVTTTIPAALPASALAGGIVEHVGSGVTTVTTVASVAPVQPMAAVDGASGPAGAAGAQVAPLDAGDAAVQGAAGTAAQPAAPQGAAGPEPSAAEPAAAGSSTASATRIRAIETTWVQVTDARGQVLLSRLLSAGEAVGIDVEPPLKIRIGNARGTEVSRRGEVIDLAASTRENIANVDIR